MPPSGEVVELVGGVGKMKGFTMHCSAMVVPGADSAHWSSFGRKSLLLGVDLLVFFNLLVVVPLALLVLCWKGFSVLDLILFCWICCLSYISVLHSYLIDSRYYDAKIFEDFDLTAC